MILGFSSSSLDFWDILFHTLWSLNVEAARSCVILIVFPLYLNCFFLAACNIFSLTRELWHLATMFLGVSPFGSLPGGDQWSGDGNSIDLIWLFWGSNEIIMSNTEDMPFKDKKRPLMPILGNTASYVRLPGKGLLWCQGLLWCHGLVSHQRYCWVTWPRGYKLRAAAHRRPKPGLRWETPLAEATSLRLQEESELIMWAQGEPLRGDPMVYCVPETDPAASTSIFSVLSLSDPVGEHSGSSPASRRIPDMKGIPVPHHRNATSAVYGFQELGTVGLRSLSCTSFLVAPGNEESSVSYLGTLEYLWILNFRTAGHGRALVCTPAIERRDAGLLYLDHKIKQLSVKWLCFCLDWVTGKGAL